MKTQTNMLVLKTNGIIELNDKDLSNVDGGATTYVCSVCIPTFDTK